MKKLKFIDLFAGLGGFHLGLSRLGHQCVYACEINPRLNDLYKKNFPEVKKVDLDITKVDISLVPSHDILCAGFPCQPFSKAGTQAGFNHKVAGNMFEHILKFIKYHNPGYLLLENVPNLEHHENGKTWKRMKNILNTLEYKIESTQISPLHFNIPQTRNRFYILGIKKNLNKDIRWPVYLTENLHGVKKTNLDDWFEKDPKKIYKIRKLTKEKQYILDMWEDFLKSASEYKKSLPEDNDFRLISPIWTDEFGATYDFENSTPTTISMNKLKKAKGSRGKDLSKVPVKDIYNFLPPYSLYSRSRSENKSDSLQFPEWKKIFIKKSRDFYKQNKKWINPWMKRYKIPKYSMAIQPTHRKFEWNCFGERLTLQDKLVSFRGSGLRVKRMDAAPTLIHSSVTQLPYIPKLNRYLSIEEGMELQGLREIKENILANGFETSYGAIGNAVNADVVEKIAETFLSNRNTNINFTIKNKQFTLF